MPAPEVADLLVERTVRENKLYLLTDHEWDHPGHRQERCDPRRRGRPGKHWNARRGGGLMSELASESKILCGPRHAADQRQRGGLMSVKYGLEGPGRGPSRARRTGSASRSRPGFADEGAKLVMVDRDADGAARRRRRSSAASAGRRRRVTGSRGSTSTSPRRSTPAGASTFSSTTPASRAGWPDDELSVADFDLALWAVNPAGVVHGCAPCSSHECRRARASSSIRRRVRRSRARRRSPRTSPPSTPSSASPGQPPWRAPRNGIRSTASPPATSTPGWPAT